MDNAPVIDIVDDNPPQFGVAFKKTHPDAVLPEQNNKDLGIGDAGYDISSIEDVIIPANGSAVVGVGLTVAYIVPGFWFKIEARSGLGFKHDIFPHPGIIDNGYRGDCGVKLYNFGKRPYHVTKGDKIAQFVIYQLAQANVGWQDEVTETDRGANGFGSSGK